MSTLKPMRFVRRLPLSGRLGLALVVLWIVVALFGPLVAPYSIGAFVDQNVFSGVSSKFPLGSDYLGRDVLSRLLAGGRSVLWMSFAASAIALAPASIR